MRPLGPTWLGTVVCGEWGGIQEPGDKGGPGDREERCSCCREVMCPKHSEGMHPSMKIQEKQHSMNQNNS